MPSSSLRAIFINVVQVHFLSENAPRLYVLLQRTREILHLIDHSFCFRLIKRFPLNFRRRFYDHPSLQKKRCRSELNNG